jgi:peptide/nickel transport system ATP-binding protein
MPVLQLSGVNKVFSVGRFPTVRHLRVLNAVSLEIAEREVLGLVGESGSGKSTLAGVISRLSLHDAGEVRLEGALVPKRLSRRQELAYRRRVQLVFQDPYASLNPAKSIHHAVARPMAIHHLPDTSADLLESCGLSPAARYLQRRPFELSGGERQRAAIARALSVRPRLLLADEPTSMLDVSIRLDVMNLLADLREREGLSLLFITHDLAAARYLSDRVAVMYAGHLVEIGPAREVVERPLHPYTQLLRQAAPKPEQGLEAEHLAVAGEVPDLANLPPGCPFAPRCPKAQPTCREALPGFVQVAAGHQVRCVLYS